MTVPVGPACSASHTAMVPAPAPTSRQRAPGTTPASSRRAVVNASSVEPSACNSSEAVGSSLSYAYGVSGSLTAVIKCLLRGRDEGRGTFMIAVEHLSRAPSRSERYIAIFRS